MPKLLPAAVLLFTLLGAGCANVVIDQDRQFATPISDGDAIVVLGRRHASDYETEPDFVECIGDELRSSNLPITVVPEMEFLDKLYPWMEPRTAPTNLKSFARLLEQPRVKATIDTMNIRYLVWLDGQTQETDTRGSIGCSIGPGGAACLGFGSWDNESQYELNIWDYRNMTEAGRISADAEGTSYMPAIVIPIPLLARVQATTCKDMGKQLLLFLQPTDTE